jgi:hypothetical protein
VDVDDLEGSTIVSGGAGNSVCSEDDNSSLTGVWLDGFLDADRRAIGGSPASKRRDTTVRPGMLAVTASSMRR